jgi:hypothetical protein
MREILPLAIGEAEGLTRSEVGRKSNKRRPGLEDVGSQIRRIFAVLKRTRSAQLMLFDGRPTSSCAFLMSSKLSHRPIAREGAISQKTIIAKKEGVTLSHLWKATPS